MWALFSVPPNNGQIGPKILAMMAMRGRVDFMAVLASRDNLADLQTAKMQKKGKRLEGRLSSEFGVLICPRFPNPKNNFGSVDLLS
ncbi:hypothetical protein RUM43_011947 [Polyplax serrata]|uniref:Uncharacterized protein n=1 Tax=Polyplax serrata TaxID=468196 RepID=A0AAN8S7H3_POLSC